MAPKYTLANGAALYAQNGSTEFKVIDSTGDVIGGKFNYGNSSDNTLADTSGQLYYMGNDVNAVQVISSGAASSGTAITGYGVTVFGGDTGGSFSMSAPAYVGVRKTIIFTKGSSIARSINSSVTTGSADNSIGFSFYSLAATNSSAITLSTGSTLGGILELIGGTTKQWYPAIPFTTLSNYSLATT